MFTEKDITNADTFVSIADFAINENIDALYFRKGKFEKLLSWITRKIYFSTCGNPKYAQQPAIKIPGKDEIIFFIKTDFLEYFLFHIRPRLKQRYKIVTGESDYTIPSGDLGDFKALLDDSLLVAWFGYNIVMDHPKLRAIPLGIPTKRALELGHDYGNNALFLRELNSFLQDPAGSHKRKLIYWGSPGNTTPSRQIILDNVIKEMNYVTITERRKYKDYLADLKQHKFVICPEGNGIDTLRIWESLHFRAVPVIKQSTYMNLYKDLFPILYVKKWSELTDFTAEFLNEEYSRFMQNDYDDRLKFDFWREIVTGC